MPCQIATKKSQRTEGVGVNDELKSGGDENSFDAERMYHMNL